MGFYRHIPIVGDFAYADGTFDSAWDAGRDFVGLVFMRLPIYGEDGTTLVGYDVRVVASQDLTLKSSDGGASWTTHRWGLYPDNNNGWLSEETNIEEASGVADAFDIQELANITTRWNGSQVVDGVVRDEGTYNGVDYATINDTTYLDDTQADGYKVINKGAAAVDYAGKENTAKIVAHAKKIVSGYLGLTWPTTMTELADAMQKIKADNSSVTNNWRYEQFFYPAAWGCALYEPTASKGAVADAYKSGQWYLPGCGELCRIYNFYRQGTTADQANFDAASEAVTPIIANAASKAGKSVMVGFQSMTSSTEASAGSLWGFFNDGNMPYHLGKGGAYYIRPVTAFTFELDK